MSWYRALPVDELTEGTMVRVELDERAVLIALVEERVRAITDVCPHNGASLSEGILREGCVTCPSHLWRFSVVDGQKQGDPRTRLAVHPTRIIDSWVEVDLPPQEPKRSLRETLLAHARGESITPAPERRMH